MQIANSSSPLRVVFKTPCVLFESPRGYFCRATDKLRYGGPMWLVEVAGLPKASALESNQFAEQIAYALRLKVHEWLAMCYTRVSTATSFERRIFFGNMIAANRLNYGAPRVCVACLRRRAIWWGVWDIALVAACPTHNLVLVDHCSYCGKHLSWHRPKVELCKCGFDFREIDATAADDYLLAMTAAIHRAAGFPFSAASGLLKSAAFPNMLQQLSLDQLLGLVLALGVSLGDNQRKQTGFPTTDVSVAAACCRKASLSLSQWPTVFRKSLVDMLPDTVPDPWALSFHSVFGSFYQYYLNNCERSEFAFLRQEFERFVMEDWPGLVRGQNRAFSIDVRQQFRRIPVQQGARAAGLSPKQLMQVSRANNLAVIMGRPKNSTSRSECWIRRDSLVKWIASRDALLAAYIPEPKVRQQLGLGVVTLRTVARSGLVKSIKGPDEGFPPGTYFQRDDVQRIKAAFIVGTSRHRSSQAETAITLRDAVKSRLGRSGLVTLARAVLSGEVAPIARVGSLQGIMGSVFRIRDLGPYCSLPRPKLLPAKCVTYAMAAERIGTNTEVVRNMVAQKILRPPNFTTVGPKLVRQDDVERFSERFVPLSTLARQNGTSSNSLARCLIARGAKLLIISLPGKGNKLFVPSDCSFGKTVQKRARAKAASG